MYSAPRNLLAGGSMRAAHASTIPALDASAASIRVTAAAVGSRQTATDRLPSGTEDCGLQGQLGLSSSYRPIADWTDDCGLGMRTCRVSAAPRSRRLQSAIESSITNPQSTKRSKSPAVRYLQP